MKLKKDVVKVLFLFLFFTFFISTESWALVATAKDSGFQFNFNNPGARSNGMGGAFISLADDASAAYTNPSGLNILTKPEVSMEFKATEYSDTQIDYSGKEHELADWAYGLSFLSFAYPSKKVTFSFYRHQMINYKREFQFEEDPALWTDLENDINASSYGIASGIKLSDSFSLGFSIGIAQLHYFSHATQYDNPSYNLPFIRNYYYDCEDEAEQYIVGLLWNPFGELNIGLVYRYGPEFTIVREISGSANSGLKTNFNVPDVFGAGLSYRFLNNLTAALDVNYVRYSDLIDDYIFSDGSKAIMIGSEMVYISDFEVDDTYEIHFGLEYVFGTTETPLAVRCGYSYIPDHSIVYQGNELYYRQFFREGEDDNVFSLGVGAVFSNFQIDISASLGDFIQEYTLSCVYRFD